jgi:hypothetical protein
MVIYLESLHANPEIAVVAWGVTFSGKAATQWRKAVLLREINI